jgi:tRNA wybutosine-synthesizing protein 2
MGFKEDLVKKIELSSEELDKIPKGFQRTGDIVIVDLSKFEEIRKVEIGEAILKVFPYIKTICSKEGPISGEFREPSIRYVAGDSNTEVVHVESGIKYKFDVTKIMFAKGNVVERVRIPELVRDGEVVVDMFAGIGYFSLGIGKLSNPEKVYSIELNPVSFSYLEENVKLNKIECIECVNGDNRLVIDKLVSDGVRADRVVMGYLPPPKEYLPWAFKIIKENGIIHYEDLVNVDMIEGDVDRIVEEVRAVALECGRDVELISDRKIKSYGPKVGHWVFDLKVIVEK